MKKTRITLRFGLGALVVLLFASSAARAQIDHEVVEEEFAGTDTTVEAYVPLSSAEVEDLVGPVALYPDDLISIVLPASTYPVQVVQAARYLQDREGNPDLQPPDDWDDAVVALLNYPEVIEMMNDDLDWTWALGDAFLNQQQDVLAAVADFRNEAYAAGNLKSDEHQVVRRVEKVIEVVPADPEVIYVPYYEPEKVVVYQPYPVYYYHPYPRYSYYYPYPANYGFSYGYFFGVSTAYRLHWVNYSLYTYNYGYRGHPYYGRNYFNRFYYRHRAYPSQRSRQRPYHRPRLARSQSGYVNKGYRGDRWQPRRRHGARPVARTHSRARADTNHGSQRQSAGNRQNRSRVNGENRSAASSFAASSPGARRTRSSQRAFSDKNRDQRRLVNRYREDAKTDATQTRRRSADRQGNRFASTPTGTTSRTANRSGAATRNSAATSRTRPAQTDRQARPTQRSRTMARENSRDVALRTSTPRRGNTYTARARVQQNTPTASTARRQARPASRPQAAAPSRQVARQTARSSPAARQARPAAQPHQARQPRQAQRARASEKPAPARSKQRSSGGRRSEPRRR